MAVVHISIGSNLGDRESNCRNAIRKLAAAGVTVQRQSSLIETEPWGLTDQPLFVNMAIEVETDLSPEALLALLKGIEGDMGRDEGIRWGPRIIDLDILFYDSIIVEQPDLTIPHPLLHLRVFVLDPLAEIAPDKIHPVLERTIRELRSDLSRMSRSDSGQ